jgi:putative transposase
VKYGVIEQMRQQYPVPPMCRFMGVSTSGYYAWRKRPLSLRDQQEPGLEAQVRAAHERSRQTFGPERLQKDLANHGVQIGVHRIKRLRAKLGLRCKQKRKFKATTNSTHNLPVAPNILDQDFSVSAPNQAWCGDITLYLSGVANSFHPSHQSEIGR